MRRTELINPTRCQVVGRSEPLACLHLDACFPREPKGAGGDWTEERGTSDEGRSRLKGRPEASGKTEHWLFGLGPSLFQHSLVASTQGVETDLEWERSFTVPPSAYDIQSTRTGQSLRP